MQDRSVALMHAAIEDRVSIAEETYKKLEEYSSKRRKIDSLNSEFESNQKKLMNQRAAIKENFKRLEEKWSEFKAMRNTGAARVYFDFGRAEEHDIKLEENLRKEIQCKLYPFLNNIKINNQSLYSSNLNLHWHPIELVKQKSRFRLLGSDEVSMVQIAATLEVIQESSSFKSAQLVFSYDHKTKSFDTLDFELNYPHLKGVGFDLQLKAA